MHSLFDQGRDHVPRTAQTDLYDACFRVVVHPWPVGAERSPTPERDLQRACDPATVARFHLLGGGRIEVPEPFEQHRCVRLGIDLAVKAQAVIALAEMSTRLNIACLFDEKTRKITTQDGRDVTALNFGSTI